MPEPTPETPKDLEDEQFVPEDDEPEERPALNIAPQDRKLVTHPYDFIIRSLKDQINDKTLVLQDKFQRRQVWEDIKASRLIESLLLNVPIPVCYFAELDDGTYSVIDGQQRLTAIYRYLNNEFALRGLRIRPDLNSKRFHQLSDTDQRLINSRSIRCIVLLRESHPDIRFDVFERLNTGSVRLNAQELRNSMYRGPLNDLLRELSEYENFKKARSVQDVDRRMQDAELVLRFFAFHFRLSQYQAHFSKFLDDYLKEGMRFAPATLDEHRRLFMRTVDDVYFIFDDHAFRRFNPETGWERTINRAVYDVIMLSFARLASAAIRDRKPHILDAWKLVCQDRDFVEAIFAATKDKRRLQVRLDKWRAALGGIGLEVAPFVVGG